MDFDYDFSVVIENFLIMNWSLLQICGLYSLAQLVEKLTDPIAREVLMYTTVIRGLAIFQIDYLIRSGYFIKLI